MDRYLVPRWTAVATAVLALAGCARVGGEAFQPAYSTPIPLSDPLGQTFRPATEAIKGVDLFMVTYGQAADPGGALTVTLRSGLGGRELASVTVGGERIADNRWVPIRFTSPVPAPEVAAIEARWEGTTPVGLLANVPPSGYDPAIQDANDPYPGGELIRGGARAQGDLAFRVVGTGGPGTLASQLNRIIRSAGGRLLRDEPAFALGWLVLLIGAAALAVTGLRRWPGKLGDRRDREQRGQRQEPGAEDTGDLQAELR